MPEYKKFGRFTLFKNDDATEENKRPNFTGSMEVTEDIPKGTKLRYAGWINKQGNSVQGISCQLSTTISSTDNKDKDLPF
tara:strand:+ start:57 stop:296 length:240 start_codon:yes stop_codon:yes gene_type:complete